MHHSRPRLRREAGGEREEDLALAYSYAPGSGAVAGAVQWLQSTLLGTVATTVAVIAVATVGLMMLSGRIDLRRGASVVLGCFILFGASSIASGIRSVAAAAGPAPAEPVYRVDPWLPSPPPPPARTAPPATSDPYAGAAVPTR